MPTATTDEKLIAPDDLSKTLFAARSRFLEDCLEELEEIRIAGEKHRPSRSIFEELKHRLDNTNVESNLHRSWLTDEQRLEEIADYMRLRYCAHLVLGWKSEDSFHNFVLPVLKEVSSPPLAKRIESTPEKLKIASDDPLREQLAIRNKLEILDSKISFEGALTALDGDYAASFYAYAKERNEQNARLLSATDSLSTSYFEGVVEEENKEHVKVVLSNIIGKMAPTLIVPMPFLGPILDPPVRALVNTVVNFGAEEIADTVGVDPILELADIDDVDESSSHMPDKAASALFKNIAKSLLFLGKKRPEIFANAVAQDITALFISLAMKHKLKAEENIHSSIWDFAHLGPDLLTWTDAVGKQFGDPRIEYEFIRFIEELDPDFYGYEKDHYREAEPALFDGRNPISSSILKGLNKYIRLVTNPEKRNASDFNALRETLRPLLPPEVTEMPESLQYNTVPDSIEVEYDEASGQLIDKESGEPLLGVLDISDPNSNAEREAEPEKYEERQLKPNPEPETEVAAQEVSAIPSNPVKSPAQSSVTPNNSKKVSGGGSVSEIKVACESALHDLSATKARCKEVVEQIQEIVSCCERLLEGTDQSELPEELHEHAKTSQEKIESACSHINAAIKLTQDYLENTL